MTFSFPITVREHYRAVRAVAWNGRSLRLAYAFFLGIPLLLVALSAWHGNPVDYVFREYPMATIGPIAFALFGSPLLFYWQVRSAHRNNPSLRGEQSYEFGPEGLRMWGPLHSTTLDWRAIPRVAETREFFLFYLNNQAAYFLPKRVVAAQGSVTELRALLAANLDGRAEVRA